MAIRRIIARYGDAGGSLLAGGLAYAALFAIVPAVLLMAGIAGAVIRDPKARDDLVNTVASVLPPLRGLMDVVLSEAVRDATPGSVLGLIALVWGASRFVVSFQEAIARVMGGDRRRGVLVENLGAFLAVLLMIAALLASTVLAGVVAFIDAGQSVGAVAVLGQALSLALGLAPIATAMIAMLLVYRFVPAHAPGWGVIALPAIGVGVALTVLARIFVFLAPRLIGSAALLGTLATVFAALAWLALSFQAVLIGAAWVRERADRAVPSGAQPVDTGSR
jgi:membrane protein